MELAEVGLKERPAHPKFLHALIFHDGSELFMVSNQNNLKACEKVSIWGKTATNVEPDTNVMESICDSQCCLLVNFYFLTIRQKGLHKENSGI